ncbi:unnamed protein product [Symbiodinium microadriaticum]|nr:unnamed protein product [Symbiodinium microadriaticum]
MVITSGDVSESLSWLTNLDREYNLSSEDYGIGNFIDDLQSKGYITDKNEKGSFELTAKSEQEIRKNALEEIFGKLKKSGKGHHRTHYTGQGDEISTDYREFEFGDAPEQIALTESLRNAQINHGFENFMLTEGDLEIRDKEHKTQTSTVLMIDISHSMILYGEDRITPAKKVAMALAELVQRKYPKDTLDVIVFGNDAWQIEIKDLPYLQEFTEVNGGNAYYSSLKGYQSRSIKEELRSNLIQKLRKKENVFEGIWGYEDTVIPDIERAILAKHNINLLGLRGQAKTRIARMMTLLLDAYIPAIEGSDIMDDPINPISRYARDQTEEHGDHTPIRWVHRDERYTEKLATPDVSIADLIGDVDPIKAASLRLPYSDERVIHFGLIPRAHRSIFVINELPDLQARIQVALFNILQEGDIQIRGFKLRLPLDVQFVFTANPEDYTNRGSIVTPLKDRIDSQIITHYPKSIEIGKKITRQEAQLEKEQTQSIEVFELARDLIEQIAFEARDSEYVDAKSGVSARLTISAYENLISTAERRMLRNGEKNVFVRVSDFVGLIPAITGKVELVYEGEQEGPGIVAHNLIGKAIRSQFINYFQDPEEIRKRKEVSNPYKPITDWFGDGNMIDILHEYDYKTYKKELESIPGLKELVNSKFKKESEEYRLFLMELALHGLAEYSMLSKHTLERGLQFKDLISSMFNLSETEDDNDFS